MSNLTQRQKSDLARSAKKGFNFSARYGAKCQKNGNN